MRWMWIDRVVSLEPGERLVAVKNVSLGEEPGEEPGGAEGGSAENPFDVAVGGLGDPLPGPIICEGMAQAGGILVGHAESFREKVVLAKITRATLDGDAMPGDQLRYTATLTRLTPQGAAVSGVIEVRAAGSDAFEQMGAIELVFSHLDQNTAGVAYPEHNFVFGEAFRSLLRMSGIAIPT